MSITLYLMLTSMNPTSGEFSHVMLPIWHPNVIKHSVILRAMYLSTKVNDGLISSLHWNCGTLIQSKFARVSLLANKMIVALLSWDNPKTNLVTKTNLAPKTNLVTTIPKDCSRIPWIKRCISSKLTRENLHWKISSRQNLSSHGNFW